AGAAPAPAAAPAAAAPAPQAAPAAAPVVEAKKPEAVEEDGFTQAAPVPMACSIDNPDCEACQ
ncbi:MAG: hypothetical protein E6Z46_07065, partial [Acinetobacter sp.]|nr:hypothetical protein [Acinetobacter sp.]